MNTFMLAIGWWNFAGSFVMLGFLYQPFGKKMLNDYTKIFKEEFKLDYWGRLWLFWAAGLNVFFGLINVVAVKWEYIEVMRFLIITDIIAYSIFILLALWGHISGKLASGVYAVYVIFIFWLSWGIKSIL